MSEKKDGITEFINCYQCICGSKEFMIGPGEITCAKCGFKMVFGQKASWKVARQALKVVDENKGNINSNRIMVIPGPEVFAMFLKSDKTKTAYKNHINKTIN